MPILPLPLFPLAEVVLFPGMVLPLHVFEERYVRMVRTVLAGDRRFGVCLIRAGEEVGEPAEPCAVGTTARITESREVAPDEFIVLAVGEERFRIQRQWHDGKLLLGEVETFDDRPADSAVEEWCDRLRALASRHLMLIGQATGREMEPARFPDSPRDLSFLIASGLAIESGLRQELLELTDTQARLEILTNLLGEQVDVLAYRLEHSAEIHRVLGGNGHLQHHHLDPDTFADPPS